MKSAGPGAFFLKNSKEKIMFTALAGIIGENEVLTVKVIGGPQGGKMKVLVMPELAKGSNPVLAQPLSLAASPQDLDSGFVGALAEFGASRAGLAEQVATTATIMEAHKKTEAGKATKAMQSKGTAAPSKAAPTSDDDAEESDDDTSGSGGGTATNAPVPAATPANNDDLLSLLG